MYKIYINETPLILVQSNKLETIPDRQANELIVAYPGKSKFLLNYIDMLEKTLRFDRVIIHHSDYKLLKNDFLSLFALVRAAGGVVLNKKGKLLVIFRKGFWDLPKGKIDSNETKKDAAIREVCEETGIKNVKLKYKVGITHHTFKTITKARNIKRTWWYYMETSDNKLTPQTDESIEKAEWVKIDEFLSSDRKMYKNIKEIIEIFLEKRGEKAPSKAGS